MFETVKTRKVSNVSW